MIRFYRFKYNSLVIRLSRTALKLLSIFMLTSGKKKAAETACIKNILIFDFHRIGDIVLLVPTLKMLRKEFPAVNICLVAGPWASVVLKNNKLLLNKIIHFDAPWVNYNYGIKSLCRCFMLIKKLRKTEWDIGIEARGDPRQILMLYFTKAKIRIGYDFAGGGEFLTDVVPHYLGKPSHLAERKYAIAEYLTGSKIEDKKCELWLSEDELEWRDKYLRLHGFQGEELVIGIHPGASNSLKKWSQEKMVELIHYLLHKYQKCNVVVWLFFGPNEDSERESLSNEFTHIPSVFTITEGLREYIILISATHLFIGMDSGGGHIASAFDVPSVILFGPTRPEISRPYNKNSEVVVNNSFDCRKAESKNVCSLIPCRTVDTIEVEAVEDVVDHVLSSITSQE